MKLCTAVQDGCGYKDTLSAHRYFAPLAKYFTVCITYHPAYVSGKLMLFNMLHARSNLHLGCGVNCLANL
jgi:hypothetical protein